MLAPDGTVLHCLPGYWDSKDISAELDLADRLFAIWQDRSIPLEQKQTLFKTEHIRHIASHPPDTVARSELQGFDRAHIAKNKNNLAYAIKDLNLLSQGDPHHPPLEAFKTTDVIMHERLSNHPFQSYAAFDIPSYVSYGCHHYDKNENEMEPGASAPIRARQLRELLRETAPQKPAQAQKTATEKKAAAPTGNGAQKRPKDIEKFMTDGFWRYMMQRDWAKAGKVASYMVERYPFSAAGFEMKALLAYEQRRYQEACTNAWQAIQLGSKHPRIIELYSRSRNNVAASSQK